MDKCKEIYEKLQSVISFVHNTTVLAKDEPSSVAIMAELKQLVTADNRRTELGLCMLLVKLCGYNWGGVKIDEVQLQKDFEGDELNSVHLGRGTNDGSVELHDADGNAAASSPDQSEPIKDPLNGVTVFKISANGEKSDVTQQARDAAAWLNRNALTGAFAGIGAHPLYLKENYVDATEKVTAHPITDLRMSRWSFDDQLLAKTLPIIIETMDRIHRQGEFAMGISTQHLKEFGKTLSVSQKKNLAIFCMTTLDITGPHTATAELEELLKLSVGEDDTGSASSRDSDTSIF